MFIRVRSYHEFEITIVQKTFNDFFIICFYALFLFYQYHKRILIYCTILNLTSKVGMNEQVEIVIPLTLSLNKRFCHPRPVRLYKK